MAQLSRDLGLLAVRVCVGAAVFAHGSQKLFGWFGGPGLDKAGETFDQMGFRPGRANAVAAGISEAGGGAMLAAGLATPAAGAAISGTMGVAASMLAPQGFFAVNGGWEYPAVLGAVAGALALTGPGSISLDHLLGHRLNRSWMPGAALGLAGPAVTAVLLLRRRSLAPAAADLTAGPARTGE